MRYDQERSRHRQNILQRSSGRGGPIQQSFQRLPGCKCPSIQSWNQGDSGLPSMPPKITSRIRRFVDNRQVQNLVYDRGGLAGAQHGRGRRSKQCLYPPTWPRPSSACARPVSLSGMSMAPCDRPRALYSVSPWRRNQNGDRLEASRSLHGRQGRAAPRGAPACAANDSSSAGGRVMATRRTAQYSRKNNAASAIEYSPSR